MKKFLGLNRFGAPVRYAYDFDDYDDSYGSDSEVEVSDTEMQGEQEQTQQQQTTIHIPIESNSKNEKMDSMEVTPNEEASSDLDQAEDESPVDPITENMEKLEKLEIDVNILELRMEHVHKTWVNESVKVSARRWIHVSFDREASFYNKLDASKVRTEAGKVHSQLMEKLLQLDCIQSLGNDKLRAKRKALVKRINDVLLPRADKLIARSDTLKEYDDAETATINSQSETKSVASMDEGDSDARVQDDEPETPQVELESLDREAPKQEQQATPKQDKLAEREAASRVKAPKNPRPVRKVQQPTYKIEERANDIVVYLSTPSHTMTRNNIQISLRRETGELVIDTEFLSEPIELDVTSREILPLKTSYELVNPHLLAVRIPKRPQVSYGYPNARCGPASYHNGVPTRAYQQRRPLSFGHNGYHHPWF